ncbi:S-adenosyl-L-methionine-dependent methyltransferase [Daedaleopsis nitida]|nr:S-adenosyl-L-methionine-dependent methyltransferase [Daedaleopsis nitida]
MVSRRPTAFGLSFPEEPSSSSAFPLTGRDDAVEAVPHASSSGGNKRKKHLNAFAELVGEKRQRVVEMRKGGPPAPKRAYNTTGEEIMESEDMLIWGEDSDQQLDASAEGSVDKPVRILVDFVIFDHQRDYEHAPLSLLDEDGNRPRQLQAAGLVAPTFVNEEDAAQEDGDDDDPQLQRLRTTYILRYCIEYDKYDEPLYIETKHAWYILKTPAKLYRDMHARFYRHHRVAQLLISTASEQDVSTFAEFQDRYIDAWDPMLDDRIQVDDLPPAVSLVKAILPDHELRRLRTAQPFLQAVIDDAGRRSANYSLMLASTGRPAGKPAVLQLHTRIGDLDLTVLRPENQKPTHVTPLIDRLAWGLFHERLQVVGPPTKRFTNHELKQQRRDLLTRCLGDRPRISFPGNRRLRDQYWTAVSIDGEMYEIGDCVFVRAGQWKGRAAKEIPSDLTEVPEDAISADYFWFAKIIHINQELKQLHVQWYQHSSQSFLGWISDPRELFLCPLCGDINLRDVRIVGKVKVHRSRPTKALKKPAEFFCQFMHNDADGSFTEVCDEGVTDGAGPPDNCSVCRITQQRDDELHPSVSDDHIEFLGITYHVDDYALLHSDNGPAHIGRILGLHPRRNLSPSVSVQLLGRMVDVPRTGTPETWFVDERELFMTNRETTVDAKDLLKRCLVLHPTSIPAGHDLRSWLGLSPLHFYVKHHCPSDPPTYAALTKLKRRQIPVCQPCFLKESDNFGKLQQFMGQRGIRLRAFDPFAGVGAFGLGLEKSGCLKVTHAVEISPSAAKTLEKNCSNIVVYNQCANEVLKYAIKTHAGQHKGPPPKDISDEHELPPPPQPGMVDCIVAGFPCQPHSTLNMFQKAHDRKSHLMLTLLAWVDFLRPKYCYFENVRGFLKYNLHATQAGRHRVEGGIDKGGLKFLVHALLSMDYQVRFAFLQAGQYGAPQDRTRFFLIAAQKTYPLPLFPQPSHSSLNPEELRMVLSDEHIIRPIMVARGTAPLKHVTIHEAIGDLIEWDWKNPKVIKKNSSYQPRNVPTIECDASKAKFCGPDTSRGKGYAHEPRTSYQKECRRRPTEDLQHITRTFRPEIVERTVNLPVGPKVDYRSLERDYWEWQNAHPLSFAARLGFIPGFYARIQKDKWFHTTVTNVQPMAKQGHVVHNVCRRIVTIRELARSQGFPDWFVFTAHENKVTTMNRQIGNAVPWPVSEALGRELREAMFKRWSRHREDATIVPSDSDSSPDNSD